ncbi:LacI family DNA-binding transcriptional regulator [Arthrobacter agilis]|uniref:LacI family DNA-binding transcriptional regulator n=1 Tax=Arthrobacter agilis TaxID=37921 RepID=UPI0023658588|nr:LacI family DNA-binding transcriptional regulator [Arthrobacter agilis]WDF33919.1 LacI family DNA-binding transcriptional regulator [Arthrobacter agilis]
MRKVRLADVAAVAGVSMKTVSNVVHDYPHVTPEMRRKVQQAIDELGYKPNLTARRLATGKTGMIALAIPEIDHPYFSELSRYIAEEASARGYRVLVEQTLSSPAAERAVLNDREAGVVDGVIFHPVSMNSMEVARLKRDVPVVLLGESTMPVTADHVMIDNVVAAQEGVAHLLAQGRERIAFLGVVEGDVTGSTDQRLLGYQQGLVDAQRPLDPRLVLSVADFTPEESARAVREALDAGLGFDGLVCRDDRFATGALHALRTAGLRVPEDVAVVGWDDTELGRWATPTLTSIAPDKRELAATALQLLGERIDGYQGIGRHRIVAHSLIVRESAPAAAPVMSS